MKLIDAFSNERTNDSLNIFVDLMRCYSEHLQAKAAGHPLTLEDGGNIKNRILQKMSELFCKHGLNEEFNTFLPIQGKGISLLTEVQMKDANLHAKIIKILHSGKDEVPISKHEGKINQLLEKHPEWNRRFQIFLSNNQSYQEEESEEEKTPLPSKSAHTTRGGVKSQKSQRETKRPREESAEVERRVHK